MQKKKILKSSVKNFKEKLTTHNNYLTNTP